MGGFGPALIPVWTFMAAPFGTGGLDRGDGAAPRGLVPGLRFHGHLPVGPSLEAAARPGLDAGLDFHGGSFRGWRFGPGQREPHHASSSPVLTSTGTCSAGRQLGQHNGPALMPVFTFMAAPFWAGGFDRGNGAATRGLVPGRHLHGHLLAGRRAVWPGLDAGLDLHGFLSSRFSEWAGFDPRPLLAARRQGLGIQAGLETGLDLHGRTSQVWRGRAKQTSPRRGNRRHRPWGLPLHCRLTGCLAERHPRGDTGQPKGPERPP
jgi:hypothetical protein